MNVKIAPSILSANFANLEYELSELEKSKADIIHIDVMDGHFVPNLTFGIPVIKTIRKLTTLPLDVHLMVTNPETYIDSLAEIGVDFISFHQEVVYHSHRLVNNIREKGIKAGIALNPGTLVDTIKPLQKELDFVLVMSVNPGFGGQSFIESSYEKIQRLSSLRNNFNLNFDIEVDGGVNDKNSGSLVDSGADILVAGSYILSSKNYSDAVRKLKCSRT